MLQGRPYNDHLLVLRICHDLLAADHLSVPSGPQFITSVPTNALDPPEAAMCYLPSE